MELQGDLAAMQHLGAVVLAVSTDPLETSRRLAGKMHLGFPILEDTGHHLGLAFGDYQTGGMNMGAVDSHAIFVLDPQGRMRWKRLAADTMHVPDRDIIAALRSI